MQEWDNILQCEGHIAKEYVEANKDIRMEDEGSVAEELDEEGGVEEDNEEEHEEDNILSKDTEDCVTAEHSEVLDDDILADEGYGAL
jgi:hypothetical protein